MLQQKLKIKTKATKNGQNEKVAKHDTIQDFFKPSPKF